MNYVTCTLFSLCCTGICLGQSEKYPEERWNLVIDHLESQKDLSGIFMIGQGEKIKVNRGFGFADRNAQVPYSDQTLYTIGSITKPFTATAILLLMEQGKLKPEDPVNIFFDQVPKDKQDITLHQLLTHSSGLPGAIGDDYEPISTLEFQRRAWDQTLLFKPGEGYEYSNVGYSLLGMIVEKITGDSYSRFLEKYVFNPAGMKTAGYKNPDADYRFLAHGYNPDGSDWGTSHDKTWNGNEPFWNLKANGGLLMSAQDMYQWYLALRNHVILTPASLQLQTTPYVDEGEGSYYGYGYAVDKMGDCVQHNGGNRIFKADFRWFPNDDIFFFSATNDANVRLFRLNDEIIRILRTGEVPETDSWIVIPQDQFPGDPNQFATQAFIGLLQQYSEENAKAFIPVYCSAGIIERNGMTRLCELFHMLHQDTEGQPLGALYSSEEKIMLVMPAKERNAKMKIILSFSDHKIDRISAELEGL